MSTWLRRHRDDLLKDLLVAAVAGVGLFALALFVDSRMATRQEVLENTRFVRQAMMEGHDVKPFSGLLLTGAHLANLPLGCHGTDDIRTGCADFSGAQLRDATFHEADVSGARFDGADLRGVDFRAAHLIRTSFTGADVAGASFAGADISQANFAGAKNLTEAVFDDVCDVGGEHREVALIPPSNAQTCDELEFLRHMVVVTP